MAGVAGGDGDDKDDGEDFISTCLFCATQYAQHLCEVSHLMTNI